MVFKSIFSLNNQKIQNPSSGLHESLPTSIFPLFLFFLILFLGSSRNEQAIRKLQHQFGFLNCDVLRGSNNTNILDWSPSGIYEMKTQSMKTLTSTNLVPKSNTFKAICLRMPSISQLVDNGPLLSLK